VQLIPSAPAEIAARAPAPAMSDAPTRLQAPAVARAPAPVAQPVQMAPGAPVALAVPAAPPMPPPSALGLGTVDPLAALGGAPTTADPLAALDVVTSGAAGPLAVLGIDASRLEPELQAALLVALRTGFNALVTKLHPQQLEELYESKFKRTAVLGLGNKARYWEMYRAHFEEIDGDRETHFRQLFGADFAAAFNDQLQKLAAAARLRGPR
jgi:type VI secretion system protein ImpI